MVFFEWKRIRAGFYHMFIHVFQLGIQLLRGEDWDPIHRFNPAICVCLSQAGTWISNVIRCCRSCVKWDQLRWEVIVGFNDIGGINYHHPFTLSFHNYGGCIVFTNMLFTYHLHECKLLRYKNNNGTYCVHVYAYLS